MDMQVENIGFVENEKHKIENNKIEESSHNEGKLNITFIVIYFLLFKFD